MKFNKLHIRITLMLNSGSTAYSCGVWELYISSNLLLCSTKLLAHWIRLDWSHNLLGIFWTNIKCLSAPSTFNLTLFLVYGEKLRNIIDKRCVCLISTLYKVFVIFDNLASHLSLLALFFLQGTKYFPNTLEPT